jgi:hypothetical protein
MFAGTALAPLLPANTFAAAGELYAASFGDDAVYKYTSAGVRSTFASDARYAGDLVIDKASNVFVETTEVGGQRLIVKITPNGTKSTFATGMSVTGMVFDPAGNLLVADAATHSIVKLTPAGVKSTFASSVDVYDMAFDSSGNLFGVDFAGGNAAQGKVYKFTSTGIKSTFATGLSKSSAIAINAANFVYVGDDNGNVFKYTPAGAQSTFATNVGSIACLAFNSYGDLFASDQNGARVIKIAHNGTKTTFGSTTSFPLGIAFEPARGLPLNIATRMQVQTGENVLIGGFIITGNAQDVRYIVVRGIGPSLAAAGIGGALQDPIIELHYPNGSIVTNDNWRDGASPDTIAQLGLAPGDDREPALLQGLGAGAYSVVLKGRNNTSGIGLIELYDVTTNSATVVKLANISTRGFVGTGDNVMIGGFILGGNGGKVIVRAIGPSLASAGIGNALSDTLLSLRDGNGTELASNDDWKNTQLAEIQATGIPPSNDRESAILTTLPNGNYTAVLSGYQGATGVALVEVYNLQ